MPTITDSSGEPLNRPTRASILRVLDRPVDVVGGATPDYALVYDEDSGTYLIRFGKNQVSSKFFLCHNGTEVSSNYDNLAELVDLFLAQVRQHTKHQDEN